MGAREGTDAASHSIQAGAHRLLPCDGRGRLPSPGRPPPARRKPEGQAQSCGVIPGALPPRGESERHPSCLLSLRRGSSRLAGEVLKQDAGHPHRVSGAVAPIGGLRPLSLARSLCAQLPGPGVNRIAREGRPPSASHDPKLPASRSPHGGHADPGPSRPHRVAPCLLASVPTLPFHASSRLAAATFYAVNLPWLSPSFLCRSLASLLC